MSRSLQDYYARRAGEYEKRYERPERQADLSTIRRLLEHELEGRRVLEVACGTGYWTRIVAPVVASLVATDAVSEVLAKARRYLPPTGRARLVQNDAYRLPFVAETFDTALLLFWWSHVPRERRRAFLGGLTRVLHRNAVVILADNRYVEGNSTPISFQDESGNTYQRRSLDVGGEYKVLKNYPAPGELESTFRPFLLDVDVTELEYYWVLTGRGLAGGF